MAILYRLQGDKLVVRGHFKKEGIWSMSGQRNWTFCEAWWDQEGFYRSGSYVTLTAITESFWMSRREMGRKIRVLVDIDLKGREGGHGDTGFLFWHLSATSAGFPQFDWRNNFPCVSLILITWLWVYLRHCALYHLGPRASCLPCNQMLETVGGTSQGLPKTSPDIRGATIEKN